MIPNVSCFVQSVFSLMTSSPFEVVQCEAAALLVELTSHPQVLEVTIDYQYILCFRLLEIVLSSFPLRRLRSFEMARKGKHCCPFKKVKIRGSQFLFVPRFEGWYLITLYTAPGRFLKEAVQILSQRTVLLAVQKLARCCGCHVNWKTDPYVIRASFCSFKNSSGPVLRGSYRDLT